MLKMHSPFESENVVVVSTFRHQLHTVWSHGLQPLVSSSSAFSLNFVLTNLSRKFLGRLYAIKGGSVNVLDKRSFDFKNPVSMGYFCYVRNMWTVCGDKWDAIPKFFVFSHREALFLAL